MSPSRYLANTNSYLTTANWNLDGLTPPAISARVLGMLERVAHVVPLDQRWFIVDRIGERFAPISGSLANLVEQGKIPGDFGEEDPGLGYSVILLSLAGEEGPPSSNSLHIAVTAGAKYYNSLRFEIGNLANPPDYSRLESQVYRDVIGAVAEAWPCPWILVRNYRSRPPPEAVVDGPPKPPFGGAWMVYLSAQLAEGLKPPPELIAEPTAGGGLVLSATQALLDQSSADDMRRSRLLEQIARDRVGVAPWGLPPWTTARIGPA